MLGSEVKAGLAAAELPFVATDAEVDITNPLELEKFAGKLSLDWVVNCSAYTAVDRAEDDVDKAYAVNGYGPGNIAKISALKGASLIHISTDYVYPGDREGELSETAPTGPCSIYGKSKLLGENLIGEFHKKHYIIRTAWLYGKHGPNFVETMLRLMADRETLEVVDDQVGSPTWAVDLADVIIRFIKAGSLPFGIYNYSGSGRCSWFQFAERINAEAQVLGILNSGCRIIPVTSDKFPTKAKRPHYSLLSKSKIGKALGIEIPLWTESLMKYLKEKHHEEKT